MLAPEARRAVSVSPKQELATGCSFFRLTLISSARFRDHGEPSRSAARRDGFAEKKTCYGAPVFLLTLICDVMFCWSGTFLRARSYGFAEARILYGNHKVSTNHKFCRCNFVKTGIHREVSGIFHCLFEEARRAVMVPPKRTNFTG